MKLTLERLSPYLPYELKFYDKKHRITHNIVGIIQDEIYAIDDISDVYSWYYKESEELPILRPLSDLFNGNYEFILKEFSEWDLEIFKTTFLSELRPLNAFDKINYTIVLLLLKNHFDIYGLIEQGLAIDINTLAQ